MPYATFEDVQERMPQFVLSPVTKPNVQTAQIFIDATHAQFDAAMENLGYKIPITGARSLAQSKEIVAQGAICKILHARAAAVGTEVALQSAEIACKQYEHALEMLADSSNPMELSDAEKTNESLDKTGMGPMGDFRSPPDEYVRFSMESKF